MLTLGRLLLVLAVALVFFSHGGWAQSADVAGKPSSEEVKSLYQEAEKLRKGSGSKSDLDRAIEIYERLVEVGHGRSALRLGDIHRGARQGEDALRAYQTASELGQTRARLEIARGHASGSFGDRSDPEYGFNLLQTMASEASDNSVMYALAEAYRKGSGTEVDAGRAFEIHKQLAEAGNPRASRRLGELYLRGAGTPRNPEAAVAAFQGAVDSGYDAALTGLSTAQAEARQFAAARATLEHAAAKGIEGADYRLARSHWLRKFGPESDSDFGRSELIRLAEGGDIAAGISALRYHDRPKTRLNGLDIEKVVAILDAAVAEGNGKATAALARFYRNNSDLLTDARDRHARLLDEHGDLLEPERYVPEVLYAIYDPKTPETSWKKTAETLDRVEDVGYYYGLLELRRIDRNAYTYSLQSGLKEAGYYFGRNSGYLDKRTIKAILRFCRDRAAHEICSLGPLRSDAAVVLARGLYEELKLWKGTQ